MTDRRTDERAGRARDRRANPNRIAGTEMWRSVRRWAAAGALGLGITVGVGTLSTAAAQEATLALCWPANNMPLTGVDAGGNPEGALFTLLDEVAETAGLEYRFLTVPDRAAAVRALQNGTCAAIAGAYTDLPLPEGLTYGAPLLDFALGIVVENEVDRIPPLAQLDDWWLGIPSEFPEFEALFPGQEYRATRFDTITLAMDAVASGQTHGYVDTAPALAYALQTAQRFDLKVGRQFDHTRSLALAQAGDDAGVQALETALLALEDDAKDNAIGRWITVSIEENYNWTLMIQLLSASLVVLVFMSFLFVRTRRLNAQLGVKTAQIANLLDNSDQGFLQFGKDLVVLPEYSYRCRAILGQEIAGYRITDLLFLSSQSKDKKTTFTKTLTAVMEEKEELTRDFQIGLLPKRMTIGKLTCDIEYKMIQDGLMMMIITDVTQQLALERQLQEEHLRLEFIVGAVADNKLFFELLDDFRQFLDSIDRGEVGVGQDPATAREETYRAVHTFKGLFGQFSFERLPKELHTLEEALATDRGSDKPFSAKQSLRPERLRVLLDTDLMAIQEVLGADWLSQESVVTMPEERARRLRAAATQALEAARSLPGDVRAVLEQAAEVGKVDLRSLLTGYPRMVENLAERLEKEVMPLEIDGEPVEVDPDRYVDFVKSLIHVFRNAVDHGIEDPETRVEADKDEVGTLTCTVTREGEQVVLQIADDGAGINPETVTRVAKERGVIPADAQLSDEDARMLIFADGFSTADAVTDISGRGVGLAAVRQEVERLEGTITLDAEPGRGTRFTFRLPLVATQAAREAA